MFVVSGLDSVEIVCRLASLTRRVVPPKLRSRQSLGSSGEHPAERDGHADGTYRARLPLISRDLAWMVRETPPSHRLVCSSPVDPLQQA